MNPNEKPRTIRTDLIIKRVRVLANTLPTVPCELCPMRDLCDRHFCQSIRSLLSAWECSPNHKRRKKTRNEGLTDGDHH